MAFAAAKCRKPSPSRRATVLTLNEEKINETFVLKDINRLRKSLTDKFQNAKDDMHILLEAFDTLSQVLVDEIEAVRKEISSARFEVSEQVTTVAKGLQSLTPEIANLRSSAALNASDAKKLAQETDRTAHTVSKIKSWAESTVRRLDEAISAQQRALSFLDSEHAGFKQKTERILEELRSDVNACRKDVSERHIEHERFRVQLFNVANAQESICSDQETQFRALTEALHHYQDMFATGDTIPSVKTGDLQRLEARIEDLHAIMGTRLTALEAACSVCVVASQPARSDRQITEMEASLIQLQKQTDMHNITLKTLQHQLENLQHRTLTNNCFGSSHSQEPVQQKSVSGMMSAAEVPLTGEVTNVAKAAENADTGSELSKARFPSAYLRQGGEEADRSVQSPVMSPLRSEDMMRTLSPSSLPGSGMSMHSGYSRSQGSLFPRSANAGFRGSRSGDAPPGNPRSAYAQSLGVGGPDGGGGHTSVDGGRSGGDGGNDSLSPPPGIFSGALERVMLESRRSVASMRQESELRQAALVRAMRGLDAQSYSAV